MFEYYYDKENRVCEMFLSENVCIDAIRLERDNVSHAEFWQVRILPEKPMDKTRIVAQCGTFEEAKSKMLDLL